MYVKVHSNGSGRRAGIPKDPFGIVAIGIRLRIAGAAGGHSQLRATKTLQEGVWPLLLLQQTPVRPFPQPHHQTHQSDTQKQQPGHILKKLYQYV